MGRADPDALMQSLPAHVFAGWARFYERSPFGPRAWDLRIAHVLAVLVQAITGQRQNPTDYLIRWTGSESEPEAQDWRSMYQTFQQWKDAHNRQDKG